MKLNKMKHKNYKLDSKKILLLLFVIALLVRLAPLTYTPHLINTDSWGHYLKAECYVENGGFPLKAFYDHSVEDCPTGESYPPLFHVLLGFGKFFGGVYLFSQILPCILGAALVFFFYPLARKFLNEKEAIIATIFVVFAPEMLVLSSTNTMPQIIAIILSITCITSFLNFLEKKKIASAAGLVISTALLIVGYPTYTVFVYLILGLIAVWKKRFNLIIWLGLFGTLGTIISLPWLIKYFSFPNYNYLLFGSYYGFHTDAYWFMLPLRIGIPLVLFLLFSRISKKHISGIMPITIIFTFISVYYILPPFPPSRNFVFLLLPLSILAASGYTKFMSKKWIKKYEKPIFALMILFYLIVGLSSVYYIVKKESITDDDYSTYLYAKELDGRIASISWGPFKFEDQYHERAFPENPVSLIQEEKIDYYVVFSKTAEFYKIKHANIAVQLSAAGCTQIYGTENAPIFDCKAVRSV